MNAWSFLLVVFGGTLPCGLLLVLGAPSIALAEPASSTQKMDLAASNEAVILLSPSSRVGLSRANTEEASPFEVAATLSSLARPNTAAPKSTQASSVPGTAIQGSSLLDAVAELRHNPQKTTPATAPSRTQDRAAPAAQETSPPRKTTNTSEQNQGAEPAKSSPDKAADPAKSSERQQKLAEADRLYRQGRKDQAEALYREVKDPFAKPDASKLAEPILDPALLPPAGQVYWREAQAGFEKKLETRTMVPLNLLVEKYPEFIPGHLRLAEAHQAYGRQKEALSVLEKAASQHPTQAELLKATIAAQTEAKQWLEASIAARQFALLNPNHPEAPEFTRLADQNLKRYQSKLRSKLRGNAIANALTGVLGVALTGSPLAAVSSIQTTALLLRGESAVGNSLAERAKRQLELVKDPEVLNYVNQLGQKLAATTGREDFKYEFYVVLDDKLNAFALPGGKVFVNAGALTKTNSEAELAGLLAHELSHATLSHGFQLATEGGAIAGAARFVPFGGVITNLVVLDYSRDMERQADILGTRVLARADYAADGMRNLMLTLDKEDQETPFTWLSSHPVTDDRVRYLEVLIERSGYNRYAYEGVERHAEIKARVAKLLVQKERKDKKK